MLVCMHTPASFSQTSAANLVGWCRGDSAVTEYDRLSLREPLVCAARAPLLSLRSVAHAAWPGWPAPGPNWSRGGGLERREKSATAGERLDGAPLAPRKPLLLRLWPSAVPPHGLWLPPSQLPPSRARLLSHMDTAACARPLRHRPLPPACD